VREKGTATMTRLRRLLIIGVAAVALSGIASADEIISYTGSVSTRLTELNNTNVALTAWDPGATGGVFSVGSDSSSYVSGQGGFVSGVTMASLNTPGIVYTLQSYDVLIQSTVSGSFSVTATGSTSANGSVHLDSYTAASLGSTMSALTSASDPANDFFNTASPPPDGGPDPATTNIAITNLAPGSVQGPNTFTKTKGADYGNFIANGGPPTGSSYTPQTAGTGLTVSGASPLNFYFSTLTGVDINLTTGNISNTQTTSISELVTVVYDFTTSASSTTPEPTTMLLFGSAMVGLGLLRKRVRR
jgi:hypothetical protein